jgi:hypothetical protein
VMCMILMWYCCEMLGMVVVVIATSHECTCAFNLQARCWLLAGASPAHAVDRARKPRGKHERQFPVDFHSCCRTPSNHPNEFILVVQPQHIHLCLAE